MLQQPKPEDFVIATGETHTLESFVAQAFAEHGLDWKQHVEQSSEFMRPTDIAISCANTQKAERMLGWKARNKLSDVVRLMRSPA
jgi:GDPmannose 4,6-dehydratase